MNVQLGNTTYAAMEWENIPALIPVAFNEVNSLIKSTRSWMAIKDAEEELALAVIESLKANWTAEVPVFSTEKQSELKILAAELPTSLRQALGELAVQWNTDVAMNVFCITNPRIGTNKSNGMVKLPLESTLTQQAAMLEHASVT